MKAWSVTWRLYGSAGPDQREDQDQEQILARCEQSKREHYERVFNDLAGALQAFATGISGGKNEAYCCHLYALELDEDGAVVSRQELDRRGGWCV